MGHPSAVEQVAGAHPCSAQLHQPVLAVLRVQPEREPHDGGSRRDAEAHAEPLACTRHVQDDKQDEGGEQPACEQEQVLRLQPLELHRTTDALVYRIFFALSAQQLVSHCPYTLLYMCWKCLFRGRTSVGWSHSLSGRYRLRTSLRRSCSCPGRLTKTSRTP